MQNNKDFSYAIVTPCFNEEKNIGIVLNSVVTQTILPKKWIIVDDESTDRSSDIINEFSKRYDWIEYCYNQKIKGKSYYCNNVYAILKGLEQLKNTAYNYLAILDADIELCPDYYERIAAKFQKNPPLGIASGTYLEIENGAWIEAIIDRRSTPKAIQVFRRECYEKCGGYLPFEFGGEDSGMEVMARMRGWRTWSFNDIVVKHHRPVGTGEGHSLLAARFNLGITDYSLGTHPLFMIIKCFKRIFWEKPHFWSGIARLIGYTFGWLKGVKQFLPIEAVSYLQKEQLNRLIHLEKYDWLPLE
jgi:glycosyltransferase involved in cell wall biosynthesis